MPDIDLTDNSYVLRDPKNHRPIQLPLSDYLAAMLAKRKTNSSSNFLFPGDGVRGYLVEPKSQLAKVIEKKGMPFAMHDLRRTFVTIAERNTAGGRRQQDGLPEREFTVQSGDAGD